MGANEPSTSRHHNPSSIHAVSVPAESAAGEVSLRFRMWFPALHRKTHSASFPRMNQSGTPVELDGLRVTVDRLIYRHVPVADKPHSFVYFISIHNDTDVEVTLQRRKWVVTSDDGTQLVFVGDGIVGQTPVIKPGGKFTYNSQHLIATASAVAEGAYGGIDENGRQVVTRIPKFRMVVPD